MLENIQEGIKDSFGHTFEISRLLCVKGLPTTSQVNQLSQHNNVLPDKFFSIGGTLSTGLSDCRPHSAL